jgi:hypothetical protein
MKSFFSSILKDKDGNFSLREVVVAIFVVATLIAWVSEQFFSLVCPEHIFYAFVSLIAAGCFGYSFEKKVKINNNTNTENNYEQPTS